MRHLKNRRACFPLLLLSVYLLSACAHTRNVVYFRDLSDSTSLLIKDSITHFEATIQPGDILDIYVSSMSQEASAIFNLGNVSPGAASSLSPAAGQGTIVTGDAGSTMRGFKVDAGGTIDYPVLGKLQVSGYTTSRLRDTLKARLDSNYLKEAVVNVRFLNFKITVLGEVSHPASYVISGERATLLDALGMAGDLTLFGKRDNILVIREENGRREFARLDLTNSKVFNSPFYFLRQNDVVYVAPTHARVVSSDDRTLRLVSISSAVLGLVAAIVLLFKL